MKLEKQKDKDETGKGLSFVLKRDWSIFIWVLLFIWAIYKIFNLK